MNRDAPLKHVNAPNADIIGIVCAVIMSTIFSIMIILDLTTITLDLTMIILDLTSIKQSLELLRDNVCPSDQQSDQQ